MQLTPLTAPPITFQQEMRRNVLSLLRAALVISVSANVFFGVTDILFEPVHNVWIGVLRFALIGAVAALWVAAHAPQAERRAFVFCLIALAIGCVQAAGPRTMHGDFGTPAMLSLALLAAVSTAIPWGVVRQLAAVGVVFVTTIATMTFATGDLNRALSAYPTSAAVVVFGMSVYAASLCRRNTVLSIQRGIDLLASRQALEAREADLEKRVRDRTAQFEAANQLLEQEMAQRQQAAEALRRSQKQLRDILDNTTAVIYLKDTQGRYVLINSQYENLFHADRERIVGQTDDDLFPQETAASLRRNDQQVLALDRALSFEETIPQDDGMHTYISLKFPLRDDYGVPYGVCGISTDITARKQMEAQLHLSQAQLTALIENTGDAIWSIDRDCRLLVINSVATDWFREAYSKPLQRDAPLDVRAPEAEAKLWRPLYEQALKGQRLVLERKYATHGELRWYLFTLTPIVSPDGITGATVFAKDITDLKRAEDRAREHQAALSHVLRLHTIGEMAAGLAHEINQPLAAISNYARGCRNRLASGDTPPGDLLPVLEEIAAQALRAGEIIRRLRYMVEKRDPTRETVDLNAVVSEAVGVVEAQLRQHGVGLRLELAPNLPLVDVDRIQIAQVIVNLLLNALEAMPAGSEARRLVTVRTARPSETTVDVTVEDTGVGLAPAIRERMFEPFFTIKPTGLGMGLTISRSIVEAHGGRLWATNNDDGGAQVHVVLPSVANHSPSIDALAAS